jgi:hypothetical protein
MLDAGQNLLYISHYNLKFTPGSFRQLYRQEFGHFPCPVDRFGILPQCGITEPLSFVSIVPEAEFNLSRLTNDWWDRYVATCQLVADKVYASAGDRRIAVMYSGGIDSTAVLVALMQHPRYQEFLDSGRLYIAMTTTSISEYPEFFYRSILPNIPITPTNYTELMLDNNSLVVTGDDGDHVIGCTDTIEFVPGVDDFLNLSIEHAYTYLAKDKSGLLVNLFKGAVARAPFEIESLCQLGWWFGQCFEMQNTMCRPYFWSDTVDLSLLATDQKVFRFFMDGLWDSFSYEYMSTNPKYTTLDSLRNFPKKYIVNYTGDQSYLNKEKILSQKLISKLQYKTRIYADLTYRLDGFKIPT